jgi:intein-encoded DNA endonuclease-like protein
MKSVIQNPEEIVSLYVNEGISGYKIAKIYGVKERVIYYWLRKYGVEIRQRAWTENEVQLLKQLNAKGKNYIEIAKILKSRSYQAIKQKGKRLGLKPPAEPDFSLTPDLAYVLGCIKGDGSVPNQSTKKEYRVELEAKDKKFVKSFYNAIKRLGLSPHLYVTHKKYKNEIRTYFRCVVHSRNLVDVCKKDMNTLKKELLSNPELAKAFIRGFYESEGSLKYCYINGRRTNNLRIEISNEDRNLQQFVKDLLKVLGFQLTITSTFSKRYGRTYYNLGTAKQDQVIDFLKVIAPCIKIRR